MSALPPRQVPRKRITRARPCCLRLEEGYGRDSSSVNKGAQRERGPPRELRAPVQASLLSVRRATLLGVVALLAACHRGGGHHETSPLRLGQPAKENPFAKGVFVCPGGYDWPAYGDVVYAPSDSRIPAADVRPKRCFASLDEAQRANFHLAPPPPGGVLIDTIYLVPPEPPLLGTCREAARRLRKTILCPTLVPEPPPVEVCGEDNCIFARAFVLSFTFSGPPGYVGIPNENANHLFVLKARVGRERSVEFLGCTGARNVQSVTVRGHAGEWIHCLGGETMNSGHVMLVWKEDGVRYAVSLHSDTVTNRAIAPAVAAGVEPVAPQDG